MNKKSRFYQKIYPRKVKFSGIRFFLFLLFCSIVLALTVHGIVGNPTSESLLSPIWRDNGPFELSPERGRFALTYSIIENGSFYFSKPIAQFIVPDLGYINGHYVSLLAPLVSFISIPGYIIGKYLGASQVGVFATSALFALFNAVLIYLISKRLGAGKVASFLASIVFLFATPAFPYATTIYEHHISTFLILLATYITIVSEDFWSLTFIWFLCAVSIPVDYPNVFLMAPIGIFALVRLFTINRQKDKIKINLKWIKALSLMAIILPLVFFLWFNKLSYGNPLQFSGTVQGIKAIDTSGNPTSTKTPDLQDVNQIINPNSPKRSAIGFFQTRDMLNGLYIHIISPDRGIIYFTPIILLGIIGAIVLYKRKNKYLIIFLAIIGADILLYSMWGDPWGGWAFGSRYLIPAYSILAIFISVALTKFRRKLFFIIPFILLLIYSISVNTLGALTSNANPPQTEVLILEKVSGVQERYSYDRNWQFLNTSGSKSFVYQTWLYKYVTPVQYFYLIAGSIAILSTGLTVALFVNKKENGKK